MVAFLLVEYRRYNYFITYNVLYSEILINLKLY
jgi:hypothetical protein